MNFGIDVANPGAVCERRHYTVEAQARQTGAVADEWTNAIADLDN
jgi:hypothetical protein